MSHRRWIGDQILEHALVNATERSGECFGHWIRPEEVVIECIVAIDAILWLQRQQLLNQIQCVGVLDEWAE